MCFSNPIVSYFYLQVRQGGKFSTVGLTFHSVVDFLCLGQRAARKERTCVHFLISKLKLELLERNPEISIEGIRKSERFNMPRFGF